MTDYLSLDGAWQVKDYYGQDWRWRDPHLPENRDPRLWHSATAPGSIANDLWQAGEIPDPYFERNSLLIEWIPARTWVYRKTFTLDPALKGNRALLKFEGVDYEAQFFLNGERLGDHGGMYTPAVFEVGELLIFDGDTEGNVLAVVLEPAPPEQSQVGRTSLVRTHKSRMTYWWDFCPRVVHLGIWDSVGIEFCGSVRMSDVFVRPQLSADFRHADVSISADLDSARYGDVIVETKIRHGDVIVASTSAQHAVAPGETAINVLLTVDQPKLWYPNGCGDQPLYEAEIRVLIGDAESDRKTTRFGIRKIELVANETDDPSARPHTLVVNGRRVYLKGWNWVPLDVMYGVERPAKLEHLLTLAQRAHVNLLRVWGGGLIEKEAFYNLCDQLGILVWQEFILSSSGVDNYPSTDQAFIDLITGEAEQIIPRKRNHPSLAIWCGGNELTAAGSVPLDDAYPLLGALHAVVERLDPDRQWLPTSPSGRVFDNSLEAIVRDPTALHDVHGPWEYQGVTGQQTLYNAGTSLLHSEFGVEGVTNLKTLNATIAPEHQQPVSLDNPIWQHLGAWWVKAKVWRETWGDVTDIETLVRVTQFAQVDGLRYALEADRRRKYQNSGTLPWQFNEPYPMAACTSAVDYYGQPKPAYYAVARAYEPIHVSAKYATTVWAGREAFTAEIWANNALDETRVGVQLNARLTGVDGKDYAAWTATVALLPDAASTLLNVEAALADVESEVFFLDLALTSDDGKLLSRNRYSFTKAQNLAPLLNVPPTAIAVEQNDSALTVTNTGEMVALFVWIEDEREVGATGFAYFSDNYFCLLPGETRDITVSWQNVPPADRRLSARGWNTNEWKG